MATSAYVAEEYVEVLGSPSPQARNANQYVEVLAPTATPDARIGELYLEVLALRPPDASGFIGWGMPL